MRARMRDGEPHVNPPTSCAIFRTSSKEDPAKTKNVCSYGGRTLETFSVTLMTSEMWTGSSTAGASMTMPGRKEEAAVVRIGSLDMSLYFLMDTLSKWPTAFPQKSSVNGMNTCWAETWVLIPASLALSLPILLQPKPELLAGVSASCLSPI